MTALDWIIMDRLAKLVSYFKLVIIDTLFLYKHVDRLVAYLGRWIKNLLKPSQKTIDNLYYGTAWLWMIVNNVPFLHNAAMRFVYLSKFKERTPE